MSIYVNLRLLNANYYYCFFTNITFSLVVSLPCSSWSFTFLHFLDTVFVFPKISAQNLLLRVICTNGMLICIIKFPFKLMDDTCLSLWSFLFVCLFVFFSR